LRATGSAAEQLREATAQEVLQTFAGQAAIALYHARAMAAEEARRT
jgi:GAF domain-containing protein